MKKILLALSLTLLLAISACAQTGTDKSTSELTFYLMWPPESEATDLPEGAIAVEGCGTDYAVPVTIGTSDASLENTLTALLRIDEANYGENNLYNPAYMSDLSAEVTEGETTTVNLVGEPLYAGHCDTPRYKAIFEKTVENYTDNYEIQINGEESAWRCLGDESGMCE